MEIKKALEVKKMSLMSKKTAITKINIDWNVAANQIKYISLFFCPEKATTDGEYIKGTGFQIDKSNKNILKNLLLYFTGNNSVKYITKTKNDTMTNFAKSEWDFNKGICLIGGVGTGKTLLMKIFKKYTMDILAKNSFVPYSAQEIVHNVESDGLSYLKQFGTASEIPSVCYFDDVASANEIVNHFGTKTNVIESLLSMRYDVFSRYGKLTHITTNASLSQLQKLYGDRVYDRMIEMFNFIVIEDNSKRK